MHADPLSPNHKRCFLINTGSDVSTVAAAFGEGKLDFWTRGRSYHWSMHAVTQLQLRLPVIITLTSNSIRLPQIRYIAGVGASSLPSNLVPSCRARGWSPGSIEVSRQVNLQVGSLPLSFLPFISCLPPAWSGPSDHEQSGVFLPSLEQAKQVK